MLENPSDPPVPNSLPAPIKRYAPPNQRNRSLNRRKSGGSCTSVNDKFHPQLITLNGCCRSEASQLLHERWKAAIHCYNDPSVDLSERPVMYAGSAASARGNLRLPHQLMSGPQMEFLAQLHHAIQNCNTHSTK